MNHIVFLDSETGGLTPAQHSLLTVGLVRVRHGRICDELHVRIKDAPYRTDPRAMQVNRINLRDHDRLAVSAGAAQAMIEAFVGDDAPVCGGHNTAFDLRFLRHYLPALMPRFSAEHDPIDTAKLARQLIKKGHLKCSSAKLEDLAAVLGLDYGAHDALGDARTTAHLYLALQPLMAPGA